MRVPHQVQPMLLGPMAALKGVCRMPGDKSVSHRALLLAAIASGTSELSNLGPGEDVAATVRCLSLLGVRIDSDRGGLVVHGAGLHGFKDPEAPLDCGNSGTTMRLLAGLLAGQGIQAELCGDASLSRRPMGRIVEPLRAMGARMAARETEGEAFSPLRTLGGALRGRDHRVAPPSAQVKSGLLLAGLYADGATVVRENPPTRDHTERMLVRMGAPLNSSSGVVTLTRCDALKPLKEFRCPGDSSSAAVLLGAAAAHEGSELRVEGVGLSPTRLGFLDVLKRMGARVEANVSGDEGGEAVGQLWIRGGPLKAVEIPPDEAPALIDELPLLAALATRAIGTTRIRGAQELRVKESDRIHAMTEGLGALGARVTELPDGWIIEGGTSLRGARIDAAGDHRVAMALAVAAGFAQGNTELVGAEWVDVSFPGFFDEMNRLQGERNG